MNSNMILHTIDTGMGVAGAAVFIEENREYYVVGVHVQSRPEGKMAVFMNEARVRKIQSWINSC
jgi:V8-like Glu-specific endopeptidase